MSCRLDDFLKIVKGDFVCAVDGKKLPGRVLMPGVTEITVLFLQKLRMENS